MPQDTTISTNASLTLNALLLQLLRQWTSLSGRNSPSIMSYILPKSSISFPFHNHTFSTEHLLSFICLLSLYMHVCVCRHISIKISPSFCFPTFSFLSLFPRLRHYFYYIVTCLWEKIYSLRCGLGIGAILPASHSSHKEKIHFLMDEDNTDKNLI